MNIYPNKQINPEKETMANKRHIQVGGGTIVMDGDVADEILPQGYIIEVSVSTPQVFPDGVLMPRKGTTEYDI